MGSFFIRRPIVAMVISIVMVIMGAVAITRLAHRPVPGDHASAHPGHHDLHGRQRARRGVVGGGAHRAAGERRRQHDLHEVDERQRRHLQPPGVVRGRGQPRHVERAGPEPRLAGQRLPAAGREDLRRHGQEVAQLPAHAGDAHLPLGRLRQQLPVELRRHQHQRPAEAHLRRRRHRPVRRLRLRHAHLGAPRPPEDARADGGRPLQRREAAERAAPGRPDRRSPRPEGHRVHLRRPHQGAPPRRRGVRPDRGALQPGRVAGAAQGRGPDRPGLGALQLPGPPRREAGRHHRRLPGARARTRWPSPRPSRRPPTSWPRASHRA